MQRDFEAACKYARAGITVPQMNLTAIRTAAGQQLRRRTHRPRTVVGTAIIVCSMAAIAAGAVVGGSHLRVTPHGGLVLDTANLTMKYHPTSAQIADAIARARFPVVMPAGLPTGTRLRVIVLADPNVLIMQYDMPGLQRRDNHVLTVFLADPSAVSGEPARVDQKYQLRIGSHRGNRGHAFRIGGEQVFVVANDGVITASELNAMKAAMQKEAAR